jgi:acyl-homoserine lactone synthase
LFATNAIELAVAQNRDLYADAIEQHHRIRHDTHLGERRWTALARPDGREVDQFDTEHAVYLLGMEPGGRVVAGSRLVPTHRPHLLSDVFPQLADIRGVPRAADVFEWTRIFVVPSRRESGRLGKSAGIIYCGILEHCLERQVRQLTVVCEPYWLPRFSGLDLRPRALGLPLEHDGMTIVAVTVDVTAAALARTREVYDIPATALVCQFARSIPAESHHVLH